jgi:hypothetical protein
VEEIHPPPLPPPPLLSMANIPIDPRQFVPPGFQILHIPGRVGVKRVVVPRRPRNHEHYAIATIEPVPPGQIPFANINEVLSEFLTEQENVGFVSLQPCPFGAAYVQFNNVSDRDRLISSSPIGFGNVHVSFIKHNEGPNWRRFNFNRDAWVLMVGPPIDHICTEDINACFADIGSVLLWERDPTNKGRLLAKVRVSDLEDIPRSVRLTEGNRAEAESWTFLVEVLQQNLLGGGPQDEDPLPADGVDPHPLPDLGGGIPLQQPSPIPDEDQQVQIE